MVSIEKCECGDMGMLDGRCVGCRRIRPSAKEALAHILDMQTRLDKMFTTLAVAMRLEEEERKAEREYPDHKHPSHVTRSSDSSLYDEVCTVCGATDKVPGGGWGDLAKPCSGSRP